MIKEVPESAPFTDALKPTIVAITSERSTATTEIAQLPTLCLGLRGTRRLLATDALQLMSYLAARKLAPRRVLEGGF